MLKAGSTSRGPSLSKAWEVSKAHKGAFSGGKVELSKDGSFLACLYESDVSFLDVEEGVATKRLRKEDAAGAEEEILSFALHPNGEEIVTASRSLLLRHWDIATGECKRAIKAHEHIVLCMDYDRTGTLVATGSSDSTVKVWDVERGYCTHNFRGHRGIVSVVAFHPDPKRLVLVSGSEDTTVRVWDLTKQSCTAVLKGHLSYVTSLAFLSEGTGLVSGGRDRVLNIWDMASSDLVKTFPVYEEVEGLQVLPRSGEFSGKFPGLGGSLLAVAGKNGVVRVFALEGQASSEDPGHASGRARKQRKAKRSASSSDALATLPKKLTCRCVMTQDNASASHKAGYTALLLDPRRGGLLGVTADHNLVLLEAEATAASAAAAAAVAPSASGGVGEGGESVLATRRQIVGYNDEVIDIKSLPSRAAAVGAEDGEGDGESWVAVATNSPQVRLFELGGFSCRLLDGHTDTVLALDVAPDGRHLCTSSKDRTCLLWDIELGVPVVRWSGHADAVGAVAASRKPGPWSSSSSSVASSGSSATDAFVVSGAADRTLQRWGVPGRALAILEEEARESASRAAASAAESVVAGGVEGGGKGAGAGKKSGWTPPAPLLETTRRSVRAHEKDINCVAVSPNDSIVASASQDRTVKLWRARDLEPMGVLTGHKRGVWKVEFSPVDRCVATCSGDRTVKLWSITDFTCLRTFQGHTASVLSVTFVSSGAQLVSGGADGLVKVWTVRSDECEATLDAHTDKVWALATARAPRRRLGSGGGEDGEGGAGDEEGGGRGGANAGLVVVSGGADSVINVWKDVTAREEEKLIAEKEATLLKEQELYNRLRDKDYGPAIALALELKRPQRLWSVLREAMTEGMGEGGGAEVVETTTEMSSRRLDKHVASWSMETIAQCLSYCRDWNTNARKSVVVHALVGSVLRRFSLASLKELPGCAELVRVLLPYSERHFQRLDRLLQSSYLVEHTLASMQMLIGVEDGVGSGSSETATAGEGAKSHRPLASELKRLREGRRREGGARVGAGGDGMSDSENSSSGSEDGEGSLRPVPVSEVVDGRVVFNVRLEAVDGMSAVDSSDDEDPRGGGAGAGDAAGTEDVVMGDAVVHPLAENGDKDDASPVSKPKKKRKKRDSGGLAAAPAPAPLGLAGQPPVDEDPSAPPMAAAAAAADEVVSGAEGEGGEASGSGKKRRKKRKKSSSAVVVEATTSLDGTQPPAVVEVEQGERGIEEGVVAEEGGSGKKKKKRSGKGRRSKSQAV